MKKVKKSQILVLAAFFTFLWATCTQAAIVYEVIDLGTLGGDSSVAYSINDTGQIVGWAEDSEGNERATLFDPTGDGKNIDLGTLRGDESWAYSINDASQIVGSASNGVDLWRHATLFDPTGAGANIDLGAVGIDGGEALAINAAGEIVGWSYSPDLWRHATLFDPTGVGVNVDMSYLIGCAYSINTAGQIVGTKTYYSGGNRAIIYDPTGAYNNIELHKNMGRQPRRYGGAYAINDAGQIVGYEEARAALFDVTGAGNNIDLGTLGGDHSEALSINDAGQIVGSAEYTFGDTHRHATLFDPTGAGNNIDLNTLIDPASGWTLERADDINSSGWIVGSGINPQGEQHAFLLIPHSSKYSGGTGDPNDSYQIATAEDLMLLGKTPEDYDKYFILTADIDLDPNLPGRKVFDRAVVAPDIDPNDEYSGFQGTPFTGVFEGNGHTISHLTIVGEGYLGLFGQLGSGAKISNLGLEAVDVNGIHCVAGLVGLNGDWNRTGGILTNCYSTGTVSGEIDVGGLVGSNYGNIMESRSTGTVNGDQYVGGLVGSNYDSIMESHSTDKVNGDRHVGGLVGYNRGSVTMSYSTSTITGNEDVGGLVGFNNNQITTSYSTGMVSGDGNVGGLIGQNFDGSIRQTYSTGMVSGNGHVGGLVGNSNRNDMWWYSFWDIETSGQSISAGGIGKTTVEMQTASTFLEAWWDFVDETANGTEDIWWIDEGQDYPRLWWEFNK